MEKVYYISPTTVDNDFFEVTLYEDEEEVHEYVTSKENLNKLIEKIEAEGYERELTEDEWDDDEDDYDILELRDQWDECDDD